MSCEVGIAIGRDTCTFHDYARNDRIDFIRPDPNLLAICVLTFGYLNLFAKKTYAYYQLIMLQIS